MNQEASEFVNATLLSSWERAKNVSQLANPGPRLLRRDSG